MRKLSLGWLLKRAETWKYLQDVPLKRLAVLLGAVFLLFSVIGFYVDIMDGGRQPYVVVLTSAAYSGLNAAIWVVIVRRLPLIFIPLMLAKEIFLPLSSMVTQWVVATFHPTPVAAEAGLHFAATSILVLVINSYLLFSIFMGISSREAFRLKTTLELAHSIQKTLVPPISVTTRCFEIYGVSHPSEKVGGDLVDVVQLRDGDTVAYLADIAGHGLQAGILMGMLKTAARTALADSGPANGDGGEVLSALMHRLNVVLPQVKEAHMYATFTGLLLNADGQVFYGMAASPPLLHWEAGAKAMARIEEQQFPLGLLPVGHFPAGSLRMAEGDMLVIATDGILEVTSTLKAQKDVEYGADALEALIAHHAHRPLPEIAGTILDAVRSYGKQADDQTLLLVRRCSA